MRTLQLIDSLEAGGAERMAVNIANALSQKIDKSYLCTTRKEGLLKEFLSDEVEYVFLQKKSVFDLKSIIFFRNFILQNNINIVHAHSSSFFLATLIKLTYPKFKLIWHDHYGNSELLFQRKNIVLRIASFFFNAIISVNTKLKDWSEHNLKCVNTFFIPNFAEKSNTEQSVEMKGEEHKRIVCLANLRPQKDHFTLLKAFKFISDKHSEWTLHLIGKEFHDDYEDAVKKTVSDLKLNSKVFFYGSTKNVHEILAKCDIGVLSSKSEGLPLALIEYGLNELAVVTTDVGECKSLIHKDVNGLVVSPGDAMMMSEAILEFIEEKEVRLEKSHNFKIHIEENYTKTKFIEKLLKVYEAV